MKSNKRVRKNRVGEVPVKWDAMRQRWMLSFFSGGKRYRRFFEKKDEAENEWTNISSRAEKYGQQAVAYSPANHAEFMEAKRIVNGRDLRDVARAYMAHCQNAGDGKTIASAFAEYFDAKKTRGVSKRHIDGIRYHVGRFAAAFGKIPLAEVSGESVLAWLTKLKTDEGKVPHPVTVANYRALIGGFFNWCARRRFIARSPTSDIAAEDLPVRPSAPKGVLTVAQCAAMMQWVESHEARFVPWFALQLFAGIRNAEAGRLTWENIDLSRRVLVLEGWRYDAHGGEARRIIKTGDDWALHGLPECLWAWLAAYEGKDAIEPPCNKVLAKMRTAFAEEIEPCIAPWPKNALRHTFCTMLMSLYGDANLVATWSRHTNAHQLFSAYVAKLVTKAEAQRFCEIMPVEIPHIDARR